MGLSNSPTDCPVVSAQRHLRNTHVPKEQVSLSSRRAWYSRGYLPHFDGSNFIQAVTFRLGDSLPASLMQTLSIELEALPEEVREAHRRRRISALLDRGHGSCWLRDERIGALVENALLHSDGQRYRLIAWCVMPNHVHVLTELNAASTLAQVVHTWKSFTAHEANRILSRRGSFWMREFHDRFIRDENHLANAVRYIEGNPVKAGLAPLPETWRFSSAWWKGSTL